MNKWLNPLSVDLSHPNLLKTKIMDTYPSNLKSLYVTTTLTYTIMKSTPTYLTDTLRLRAWERKNSFSGLAEASIHSSYNIIGLWMCTEKGP